MEVPRESYNPENVVSVGVDHVDGESLQFSRFFVIIIRKKPRCSLGRSSDDRSAHEWANGKCGRLTFDLFAPFGLSYLYAVALIAAPAGVSPFGTAGGAECLARRD